jgi:hypothetical protein
MGRGGRLRPRPDTARQPRDSKRSRKEIWRALRLCSQMMWSGTRRAGGPLAGDHRGKDQVMSMLGKQAELTGGTFRAELHDLLANDEHGVLFSTVGGRARGEDVGGQRAPRLSYP